MEQSNLPRWPSDIEKQTTEIRRLLRDSPQSASELAEFFFEGETILLELVRCLEANAALGFAAVDRKGWVATQPIGKTIYGSQRQLKGWSIDALINMHSKHQKPDAEMLDSDWKSLLSLYFELQFRNTPKSKSLRQNIRDRLILNRRFPGDDQSDETLVLS